jgi:hypothetical protein
MLVFTSSRERTESEYDDLLHRAGLALVKTTPLPHNSAFSRPHLPKTNSAGGFLSATDLDQLRWTAEARMPVRLRNDRRVT